MLVIFVLFLLLLIINYYLLLAACSLERIESDNYLSEKYVYVENEGVSIKCKDGFKINGSSHLTCLESGSWNENMPLCEGEISQ